jgi:hypothetical protein
LARLDLVVETRIFDLLQRTHSRWGANVALARIVPDRGLG